MQRRAADRASEGSEPRSRRDRFGSGDETGFDQNEFQAGRRVRIILEPVQKDRIVIVHGGGYDDRSAVSDPALASREMCVRTESLGPVGRCEVMAVLVPVQMQEGRREHSGH